jgi:hypothetical protein
MAWVSVPMAEFVLQQDLKLGGAEELRVTGFRDAMGSEQSEPADRLRDYIGSKHTHDGECLCLWLSVCTYG